MVSRSMCIPWPLLSYVSGALLTLCESWNWEEHGDMSPDTIAEFFTDIHDAWVDNQMTYVGQVSAFIDIPDCWAVMDGTAALDVADYPELAAIVPASWISGTVITIPSFPAASVAGVEWAMYTGRVV